MSSNSSLAMAYPTDPPPSQRRSRGRGRNSERRPNLTEMETLVHVLLSEPNVWHVVDSFDPEHYSTHYTSAVYMALWRRGFDVATRTVDGEKVVWARWPHPVPEWVVVSARDERQIKMSASTTDPQWHQLILDLDE